MCLFIYILIFGFIYEIWKGVLKWNKANDYVCAGKFMSLLSSICSVKTLYNEYGVMWNMVI